MSTKLKTICGKFFGTEYWSKITLSDTVTQLHYQISWRITEKIVLCDWAKSVEQKNNTGGWDTKAKHLVVFQVWEIAGRSVP